MSTKKRCLKNLAHEFEKVNETPSHIVNQCWRCKIKTYKARGFTAKERARRRVYRRARIA